MPHACDNCDHQFPDGSQEMLSGCPSCGGNKFQFIPEGADQATDPEEDDVIIDGDDGQPLPDAPQEDTAQQSARSDIIQPDDESEYSGSVSDLVSGLQSKYGSSDDEDVAEEDTPDGQGTPSDDVDGDPLTDVDELRDQLMTEFESIKIVEPGEYELNLVKLFEREEHIIQIQEDGRYVIQMPER